MLGQPERYVCKYSDKIIVPSKATKKAILLKRWAEENKVSIVYEGVGNNFYKRTETEIIKVKEKYNIGAVGFLQGVDPGLAHGIGIALFHGDALHRCAVHGFKGCHQPRKPAIRAGVCALGRADERRPLIAKFGHVKP